MKELKDEAEKKQKAAEKKSGDKADEKKPEETK